MDVYAVLGLSRVATLVEIKRAYRRLARRYHPDINPGDGEAEARFKQIAQAYAVLSDVERRRTYDLTGRLEIVTLEAQARSYGFEGFDFSASVSPSAATTFGDLFAEMFGGHAARQPTDAVRGADLHVPITMRLEDAAAGIEHPVTVTRRASCSECHGAGTRHTTAEPCPRCQGEGSLRSVRGHMVFAKPCTRCGGTGNLRVAPCRTCGGAGVEARSETTTVVVPAGTSDGAHIHVAGRGNAGLRGGPPGELIVVVHVDPHPLFRREGDDLHVIVPVATHEAALGAKIEVPTLKGPARLRIPAGTQSGQRFRVYQRGVPSPRDGRPGDLVVEVRLVLPRSLDERSKELLRQLGELHPENVRRELLEAAESRSTRRD